MKTAMQNAEMQKVADMLKDIKFAMLTSVGNDGRLRSRPMTTIDISPDGSLWFFTDEHSEKTNDLSTHPQVNVAYSDIKNDTYVSVTGRASVSQDRQQMETHWSPMLKAWFPKGLDDPNIALLKVEIESAEFWDVKSSKMTQLFDMLKAAATGTCADDHMDTDHKEIKVM